jgi:aldose 1-epimerase
VPWSQLAWEVTEATTDQLAARLDWSRDDLLAVFPFPHRLDLRAKLRPDGLTLETTLRAGPEGPVPVCFGFHPYFAIPALPRSQWRLELPAMRRLVLDPRGIPTGEETAFGGFDAALGEHEFDDGFTVLEEPARMSVAGGGIRITVELLAGYPYAQVFAPKGQDYVALEPMTAPTSALTSGKGLRLVGAGRELQAAFRISVKTSATGGRTAT